MFDKKKNTSEILYDDNGMIQKPDNMSKIVTVVCIVLIVILVIYGILAYVAA